MKAKKTLHAIYTKRGVQICRRVCYDISEVHPECVSHRHWRQAEQAFLCHNIVKGYPPAGHAHSLYLLGCDVYKGVLRELPGFAYAKTRGYKHEL